MERTRFNIVRVNYRNWGQEFRDTVMKINRKKLSTHAPKHLGPKSRSSTYADLAEAYALVRELAPTVVAEIQYGVSSKFVRCPICQAYELCDRKTTILACGRCCAEGKYRG